MNCHKTVGTEFIQRYVFPDGELDSVSNVQRVMERTVFKLREHAGPLGREAPQILSRHRQSRAEAAPEGPENGSAQAMESQSDRRPGDQALESIQPGPQRDAGPLA
ncbi:MAG: class I SAM-dependent methyltransferase [Actinobacteria bacterium]|nr:class I SAM-dependent methyltransferase [Actinomycetota bacterium]